MQGWPYFYERILGGNKIRSFFVSFPLGFKSFLKTKILLGIFKKIIPLLIP